MKYKIFDLDNTLFRSPVVAAAGFIPNEIPDSMKPLKDNFNKWWDHPISFDERLLTPGLDSVHEKVIEAYNDKDSYSILITHRIPEMRDVIVKLLQKFKLGFDLVIVCKNTIKKPDILLRKHPEFKNATEVEVYEDSIKQILDYRELFEKMDIPHKLHLISLNTIATLGNFEVTNLEDVNEFLI